MMNRATVGIADRPTAADLVAERIIVSHHVSSTRSMSRTSRLEIEQ